MTLPSEQRAYCFEISVAHDFVQDDERSPGKTRVLKVSEVSPEDLEILESHGKRLEYGISVRELLSHAQYEFFVARANGSTRELNDRFGADHRHARHRLLMADLFLAMHRKRLTLSDLEPHDARVIRRDPESVRAARWLCEYLVPYICHDETTVNCLKREILDKAKRAPMGEA